jgi:hypothetical protein
VVPFTKYMVRLASCNSASERVNTSSISPEISGNPDAGAGGLALPVLRLKVEEEVKGVWAMSASRWSPPISKN